MNAGVLDQKVHAVCFLFSPQAYHTPHVQTKPSSPTRCQIMTLIDHM